MKKIIVLMISVLFVGLVNAQVDTTPQSRPLMDTVPPVSPNTMDTAARKWKNDSFPQGNKDSSLGKWNADTTSRSKWNLDTTANKNENMNSSSQPGNSDSSQGMNKMTSPDSSATGKENTDKSNSNTATETPAKVEKPLSDRVMMKDGQVVLIKNGEETKIESDYTLPSGVVVTTTGNAKMKDGSSVKLKDGQYIEIKEVKAREKAATTKKTAAKKKVTKKKG